MFCEEAYPEVQTAEVDCCPQDRILIVDDDQSQAEVLAYRFGGQGYKTLVANSGRDGLGVARSEHPDLIVLDLRLPDVDGLNVCQELSDDCTTSRYPGHHPQRDGTSRHHSPSASGRMSVLRTEAVRSQRTSAAGPKRDRRNQALVSRKGESTTLPLATRHLLH